MQNHSGRQSHRHNKAQERKSYQKQTLETE